MELKMSDKIKLSHGDGGIHTAELIKNIFLKNYGNELTSSADSFTFDTKGRLAYTTDSFIVKPLFFKGGDIGKLSICGTVNDLAAAGAIPLYISAGFIIEEGFDMEKLDNITQSMNAACITAGAQIVTGDTKVVEKGNADGLFINTSGIGRISKFYRPQKIESGDEVIITGGIAEHGTVIMLERLEFIIESDIRSDCCPMNNLITELNEDLKYIKKMKDPTRGGLATILNEIAEDEGLSIELQEEDIPIKKQIKAINDILGTDPLYLACEGRMLLVVQKGFGDYILQRLKSVENCEESIIIGKFTSEPTGTVYINTQIGGKRIIPLSEIQNIPRIS
jgi:hydrogenase expression/formation protein HypE